MWSANKWWIGKDVKGSGHDIVLCFIPEFAWRDWRNTMITSATLAGLWAKIFRITMFAGRNTRTFVITIIFFKISLVCKKFFTHCFVKIIYAEACFSAEPIFFKSGKSTDKTTIDSARIPFLYWKERQQWQIERLEERNISIRCPVLTSDKGGRACRLWHLANICSLSAWEATTMDQYLTVEI